MLVEIKGQSALGDIYKHQVSPERMNKKKKNGVTPAAVISAVLIATVT